MKCAIPLGMLVIALLVSACASINEGAVEHRVVPSASRETLDSHRLLVDKDDLQDLVDASLVQFVSGELRCGRSGNARDAAAWLAALDSLSADELDTAMQNLGLLESCSPRMASTVAPARFAIQARSAKPDAAYLRETMKKIEKLQENKLFQAYADPAAVVQRYRREPGIAVTVTDMQTLACDEQGCAADRLGFSQSLKYRSEVMATADRYILNKHLPLIFEMKMKASAELVASEYLSYQFFKPSDSDSFIEKGDVVTVSLLQAFICDFQESGWDNFGIPGYKGGIEEPCREDDDHRGEILITANVFEKGNGKSISFKYSDIGNGRAVFYTEDAREYGQYLNFSNMPVYGPITYSGRPMYLEFNIVELDTEEVEKVKGLLGALSNLGGAAYPPSSPVLEILNTLTGAMLTGSQDDLEFRYHTELVAKTDAQSPHVSRAFMREGTYVLLRGEDRSRPLDWDNLRYDPSTGRLQIRKEDVDVEEWKDYRKGTYLVVQLSKGDTAYTLDQAETVAQLLGSTGLNLKANANDIAQAFEESAQALKALEGERRAKRSLSRVSRGEANANEIEAALKGACEFLASGSVAEFDAAMKSLAKPDSQVTEKSLLTASKFTEKCLDANNKVKPTAAADLAAVLQMSAGS